MRKKISCIIICFVLLTVFALPSFAANQVNTINIQAVINQDGSMNITQNWKGALRMEQKYTFL